MMTSKVWCRSGFGGMVQARFPQTGQGVRRSRVRAGHEVSVPSRDRRRHRPGVSGGVPHNCRSDGVGGVADGLDHSSGQGAAQVSSFHEAPQGVAGTPKHRGRLGPAVPRRVGAHAVVYGAFRPSWVVSSPAGNGVFTSVAVNLIPPVATFQYSIVQEKLFARNALQDIVLEPVLWCSRGRKFVYPGQRGRGILPFGC